MLRLFRRNRDEEKKATEQAVKPSRERWFGRIANLLRSSRLDDSVWDEIEEILISSDVGVETSLRIIDRLKQQVRQERLDSPEAVTEALKQALTEDLATGPRPPSTHPGQSPRASQSSAHASQSSAHASQSSAHPELVEGEQTAQPGHT